MMSWGKADPCGSIEFCAAVFMLLQDLSPSYIEPKKEREKRRRKIDPMINLSSKAVDLDRREPFSFSLNAMRSNNKKLR